MKEKTKKRKVIRILACVFCIAFFVGICAIGIMNAAVIGKSKPYFLNVEQTEKIDADCILVLGAGIVENKYPSPILADRIDKGIEVYKEDSSKKLLMSGDHGRVDHDEVNIMKARAVRNNIPEQDVFMDHAGFSTYESMYRAKEVFGAEKIIIVTQRYHLYRAVFIARALGLEAYGVPAEDISYPYEFQRELREVAARCKDIAFSVIKPVISYDTDVKVDLTGSGSVTNDANTPVFCGF